MMTTPAPGSGGRSLSRDKSGPRGTPRDRALRLLGARDRSRRELEVRLLRAGFEAPAVSEALDRLEEVGLVDDERFARTLAEHTISVRGSGRRAAREALFRAGVDRGTAEEAVEGVEGDDEARAVALARRRASRLRGLEPGAAFRRLHGFLVRRGHDPALARRAALRALELDGEDD